MAQVRRESPAAVEPILRVIAEGRPFLGICVGMQLLFTDSVEFGLYQGLDVIPGHVLRFPENMRVADEALKVPQMGWNQLHFKRRPPTSIALVRRGLAARGSAYFTGAVGLVLTIIP